MFFSSGSFTNLNSLKMSEKVCRQMEVITFVPTANCAIIQSFPKIVLRIDEGRSLSAPVHAVSHGGREKHLPKKYISRSYITAVVS